MYQTQNTIFGLGMARPARIGLTKWWTLDLPTPSIAPPATPAAPTAAILPKAAKQAHNRLYRKKHKKNKGTGSASFPTLFYDLSLK